MDVKKSTTWSGKLKKLEFNEGQLVDEDGVIVDLMNILENFYKDKVFDISVTAKQEEIIEYEETMD
jgi:hypothetical protein